MLRPTILSFLAFYYNDFFVIAIGTEALFFLYEYFWGQGTLWWQFLAQIPLGLALAAAGRYKQRRLKRLLMLWPLYADNAWLWSFLIAMSVAATTLIYKLQVVDPGNALQNPFSEGVLLCVLLAALVLLVIECIGYFLGHDWCNFRPGSLHPLALLVIIAVATFDEFVFLQGYYVALVLLGFMALCFAVDWLLVCALANAAPEAALQRQFEKARMSR